MVNARPLLKKNNHSRPFAFDFRSNPFTIEYRPRHLIIIGNEMNRWIKRDSVILMRGPFPRYRLISQAEYANYGNPPLRINYFPKLISNSGQTLTPQSNLLPLKLYLADLVSRLSSRIFFQ